MRSAEELRLLAGVEFNAILAADPELARLDALKYDSALDARNLLELLNLGDWRIGDLPVRPLTAAKWAFLWLLDNPLVTGGKPAEPAMDVALYVLSHELSEIPCGISGIPAESAGYTRATGLPNAEAAAELASVVRGAFHPLAMIPRDPEDHDGEPARYDAVWCAAIAGVAARELGYDLQYCLHRMPLSAVCACYVNWRRRESIDGAKYRYRPNAEVLKLIDARVDALAEEFLKGKVKTDPVMG